MLFGYNQTTVALVRIKLSVRIPCQQLFTLLE